MKTKQRCIERLAEEWRTHGKVIIAADFDDTLKSWKMMSDHDIEETGIVKLLKECLLTGAYLVCFTASTTDRYPDIIDHFNSLGIPIHSINENPIHLPYGQNGKIYANIFLDDRAGLDEALEILEAALYRQRAHLQMEENLPDFG